MNIKIILTTLGFSVLTPCATTEQYPNALLTFKAGVLCDQYVCVDQNGIAAALTQQYLGDPAIQTLGAFGEFDITAMTFATASSAIQQQGFVT